METFTPRVSPAVAVPDPGKHVNYTYGMVLGVDDFTQEFAYLSGRDQWLARDAIGYGTLSGLKVKIENDEKGPRVLVKPGVALSPRGQLIRVTPAQCAYLNPWLAANSDKLGHDHQDRECCRLAQRHQDIDKGGRSGDPGVDLSRQDGRQRR